MAWIVSVRFRQFFCRCLAPGFPIVLTAGRKIEPLHLGALESELEIGFSATTRRRAVRCLLLIQMMGAGVETEGRR
jgi:hypothetical protein